MYGGIFLGHFVSRVCPLGNLLGALGGLKDSKDATQGVLEGLRFFLVGGVLHQ